MCEWLNICGVFWSLYYLGLFVQKKVIYKPWSLGRGYSNLSGVKVILYWLWNFPTSSLSRIKLAIFLLLQRLQFIYYCTYKILGFRLAVIAVVGKRSLALSVFISRFTRANPAAKMVAEPYKKIFLDVKGLNCLLIWQACLFFLQFELASFYYCEVFLVFLFIDSVPRHWQCN